jgi:hypothetical protein
VTSEGISASASDNVVDIHSSEEHTANQKPSLHAEPREELLVDALPEGHIDHVVNPEDVDTDPTAPAIASEEVLMDVSNYTTD